MSVAVATVGDKVFFPKCSCGPKIFPILTGSTKFFEGGKGLAQVGSIINSPKKPRITTGSSKFITEGKLVSGLGDKAFCYKCGMGTIITGSGSRFM